MSIIRRKKNIIAGTREKTMTQKNKTKEKLIKDIKLPQKRIAERDRKYIQHTQRKQAEENLKHSFSLLHAIFDSILDGVLLVNQQGVAINSNKRFQKMWNIPKSLMLLGEDEKLLEYVCNQLKKPEVFLSGVKKLYAHPEAKSYDLLEFKNGRVFERYSSPQKIKKKFVGRLWIFHDITKRKQVEQELLEAKTLIDAVVENIPLMIFLKEAKDLRFVVFNRAGEELLGYDRKSLLGKNNLDLFPPEQAAHFMAKDREALDGEAGVLNIPEEPILTAKKGTRLLHTRKVCIRGADGKTKFLLGISEDITERKQAEEEIRKLNTELEEKVTLRTSQLLNANLDLVKEIAKREELEERLKRSLTEKELLLKEVNHRVKNNLQTISGILGLQIMQSNNEEIAGRLKDAQERVNSMALLQGMLHQAEHLNEINFEEYIKTLAANLSYSHPIQPAELEMIINAPGILLDINTAIPCGLIINELMTNSLRHAFRNRKGQKIWLDFNLDSRKNFYVISLRDNGIGMPEGFDSEKTTTLGLQLVNGLTKQLNGTLAFQNNGGAQFTITFPNPEKEVISNG